ncbi:MAG: glucuronate isomerase [Luteolibacter sp.]
MSYLHDNFLLPNKTGQWLFHDVANLQPILDYHCHLSPQEIADNVGFSNLSDIWLGGDHYKWRAMRAAGIPEALITGKDSSPKEKFDAWARTVPQTLRNPLHHWTHLELRRYFGIEEALSPKTADAIWEKANERIAGDGFTSQAICEKFNVSAIGTTDDPVDDLRHHIAFNKSGHRTKIFPTFRPDKAMITTDVVKWNEWTEGLSVKSQETAVDFVSALKDRHDFFHENGCRLTDHGLESCPFLPCSDAQAEMIFKKLRCEENLSSSESEQWMTYILQHVARWNTERGWTMQFHLGAIRNANTGMFRKLGPDAGFDSTLDEPVTRKLVAFLDSLTVDGDLPQSIFYHLNPATLNPLATMMGNYQDGITPGKMQLGAGWWHVDTLDGMRTQIEVLSSVGLLSRFVGMLTDSRSFLSFPRHEYFRRLLCGIIGQDVETGLIPDDRELLTELIEGICYQNAHDYFKFPGI